MPLRHLFLLGALPILTILAGCSHNGKEVGLPTATNLSFAAGDPNAARYAAEQCAAYGMKAVPDGKGDSKDSVRFACK